MSEFNPKKFMEGVQREGGVQGDAPVPPSVNQIIPNESQLARPTADEAKSNWKNRMGELEQPNNPEPISPEGRADDGKPVDAKPADGAESKPEGSSDAAYQFKIAEEQAKKLTELIGVEKADDLSFDKILERIEGFNKRDEEMTKKLLESGIYESESLNSLREQAKLEDDVLVENNLKALGLSEEEIDEQMKIYDENDNMDVQAKIYRRQLESKINSEIESLKEGRQKELEDLKAKALGSKTEEAINSAKQMFNERLSSIDNLLGVSLGKDQNEIAQKRKEIAERAAKGDVVKEILADPESYLTAVFFHDNKDTVLSVSKSAGIEAGKRTILSKITHPEIPDRQKSPVPSGNEGFNPEKWTRDMRTQQ